MNMGGDFDSAFRLDQIADKLLAMLGKGPDVVWAVERESLISRLVLAAEKQELRVRHPETLLPEVFNDWPQPSSFALVCTVADVNAWLESGGVPYRLDAHKHVEALSQSKACETVAERNARWLIDFDREKLKCAKGAQARAVSAIAEAENINKHTVKRGIQLAEMLRKHELTGTAIAAPKNSAANAFGLIGGTGKTYP